MRSFLGITAHYISDQWQLESVMLGCNRVTGRHTTDNIMLWYDEVVSDFDVREKVKHIITDSASNIKKAFLTLSGYKINASDSEDEESKECDSISIEQDELTFEYQACFAHTLQLVVKDGMAKAGQISTVIKKCSNLVSFVHRSTIAADVLRGKTRLQADNETRWNSQLKMIKSVSYLFQKVTWHRYKMLLNSHLMNEIYCKILWRFLFLLKRPPILYRLAVFHQ